MLRTAPESWQFCSVSLICSRGGGGRQRQQWHLIPLPTRAGRWEVWQGPRLGFVTTGRFVTMDDWSTIFLLLCLASYFFFQLSPALSRHVSFLCRWYPASISEFLSFYSCSIFFSYLFLRWRFWLSSHTRYASTWAAYLDSLATFVFSRSHCLTTEFVSLQDEESGRTLGVLLLSLGRKNAFMWKQQQQWWAFSAVFRFLDHFININSTTRQCCALVPDTLAFDSPTLINYYSDYYGFSLLQSVTTEFVRVRVWYLSSNSNSNSDKTRTKTTLRSLV